MEYKIGERVVFTDEFKESQKYLKYQEHLNAVFIIKGFTYRNEIIQISVNGTKEIGEYHKKYFRLATENDIKEKAIKLKVGDKVVFTEETAICAIEYYRYSESDAKQIMEITSIKPNGFHIVEIMSNRIKTIPFGNKESYRLATENEIKLDKIKRLFINK